MFCESCESSIRMIRKNANHANHMIRMIRKNANHANHMIRNDSHIRKLGYMRII